jgi:hypothetical protein
VPGTRVVSRFPGRDGVMNPGRQGVLDLNGASSAFDFGLAL